jgi:N-acetylneuraminic acid mutarotase
MQKAVSFVWLAFVIGCSESDPAITAGGAFAWTEVTPCPIPRFEASGAVVDGELWVMGGFLSTSLDVTKRIDIYDPSTDRWRLGPELPGAETHAGVVSLGTRDFVMVGGFEGNVLNRLTTAGVWRWNGASASWSSGPDLPSPRAAVFAALVGNELHAAGGLGLDGDTDSAEHVVWNLAGANAWTAAAPLTNPRNHGGGSASGGRFFAVSGRHGWDEVAGDDPALTLFDPGTNSWSARAPMLEARSEIGSATVALADGRFSTIGGSITGKIPSDDVLVYDPSKDVWSKLPALPLPLKGVVAVRIGSKLIVSTGSPTSTDPTDKTYVGCCL